jgi:hypothetical protein
VRRCSRDSSGDGFFAAEAVHISRVTVTRKDVSMSGTQWETGVKLTTIFGWGGDFLHLSHRDEQPTKRSG